MAELSEQIQASQDFVKQLIEMLHVPSYEHYEKCFHSRHYVLFIEYSPTGESNTDSKLDTPFRIVLTHKGTKLVPTAGKYPPGIKFMNFYQAADGYISCLGNGNMDQVVEGLGELVDHFTKVVAPAKEIIQILLPQEPDHRMHTLTFDAWDAMLTVSATKGCYRLSAYRGNISPSPHNVLVQVELDKDFKAIHPTRTTGELAKVYRTMECVLTEVKKGTIKIIKQEITDG